MIVKHGGMIWEDGHLINIKEATFLRRNDWGIAKGDIEDCGKSLGAGSFGVVKLCRWKGTYVAVKELDKFKTSEKGTCTN